MNKKVFLLFLSFSVVCKASDFSEKTVLLHQEMAMHKNPNITPDSHSTLYELVQGLADKAGVAAPEYISVFDMEYDVYSNHQSYKRVRDADAYTDIWGDVNICRETLTDLSYDEVEGVVAVAMAEKVVNKPFKLAVAGVSAFGVIAAAIYGLNKSQNLGLGAKIGAEVKEILVDNKDWHDAIPLILTLPTMLAVRLYANSLQKTVDLNALKLTNKQNVINGIKGLSKVTDAYAKQNILGRLMDRLKLKDLYARIFYPVRAFTYDERVEYLERVVQE